MFEALRKRCRGRVGVGTLIVVAGLLLLLALAAGVVVTVVGSL